MTLINSLTLFKNYMGEFCKNHSGVHSVQLYIDHNHKNVIITTTTDNWDFDLEGEIFSGPYSVFPVETTDGYYIDQRVTFIMEQ